MSEMDLESKIRSLRVPARDEEYWEDFTDRVLRQARRSTARPPRAELAPVLAWLGHVTLACGVAMLCLWEMRVPQTVSRALIKDERAMRSSVRRLEKGVTRFMQDEHGLHYLVEEPT